MLSETIEEASEKFGFHKVSLLRNFCKKVGIQLLLREYQLDSKAKAPFSEEDVLNLFPVIKHLHPKVLVFLGWMLFVYSGAMNRNDILLFFIIVLISLLL